MRVISSRFQLEHLADDLGIFEDPEFNAALRNPDRDVQMQVQGPFEYLLSWVPDEWLVATGLAAEPSDTMATTSGSPARVRRSRHSGTSLRSRPRVGPM